MDQVKTQPALASPVRIEQPVTTIIGSENSIYSIALRHLPPPNHPPKDGLSQRGSNFEIKPSGSRDDPRKCPKAPAVITLIQNTGGRGKVWDLNEIYVEVQLKLILLSLRNLLLFDLGGTQLSPHLLIQGDKSYMSSDVGVIFNDERITSDLNTWSFGERVRVLAEHTFKQFVIWRQCISLKLLPECVRYPDKATHLFRDLLTFGGDGDAIQTSHFLHCQCSCAVQLPCCLFHIQGRVVSLLVKLTLDGRLDLVHVDAEGSQPTLL